MFIADPSLLHELFGSGGATFRWCREQTCRAATWTIFCNRDYELPNKPEADLYHATTLWQCQLIMQEGFKVGMYHPGSKSSPKGVWGCDQPGHAVDRCPLSRGWSHNASELAVSGWDCPVVIRTQSLHLKTHKYLENQKARVRVHKSQAALLPLCKHHTEIWIHQNLFARFRELSTKWAALESGKLVVCRARRYYPQDLWKAGHNAPMTCGRTCIANDWQSSLWVIANETRQLRCYFCDHLAKGNRPGVDFD